MLPLCGLLGSSQIPYLVLFVQFLDRGVGTLRISGLLGTSRWGVHCLSNGGCKLAMREGLRQGRHELRQQSRFSSPKPRALNLQAGLRGVHPQLSPECFARGILHCPALVWRSRRNHMCESFFPEITASLLGVVIQAIVAFGGLYWGPLVMESPACGPVAPFR